MPGAVSRVEYPRDYALSSNMYISATVRVKEVPEDNRYQKLIVRNDPKQCDHTANICKWCWFMWEQDYELNYNRTVAGRRLEAERVYDNNPLRNA